VSALLILFVKARLREDAESADMAIREQRATGDRSNAAERDPSEHPRDWRHGTDEYDAGNGNWLYRRGIYAERGGHLIAELLDDHHSGTGSHIARHDPLRTHRFVRSITNILTGTEAAIREHAESPYSSEAEEVVRAFLGVLVEIAGIWSDHAGYGAAVR